MNQKITIADLKKRLQEKKNKKSLDDQEAKLREELEADTIKGQAKKLLKGLFK